MLGFNLGLGLGLGVRVRVSVSIINKLMVFMLRKAVLPPTVKPVDGSAILRATEPS